MTKDDVKLALRQGKDIATTMKQYFHEQFVSGEMKPLEIYKAGDLEKEINKSGDEELVKSVQETLLG